MDEEFGTAPVGRLFARYATTALVGNLGNVVQIAVEGLILGVALGAHGLAVVSILVTVEYLSVAHGSALGAATSTEAGAYLGEGDVARASHAFSQGFWLTLITGVVIAIPIFVLAPQVATLAGATSDIASDATVALRGLALAFPLSSLGELGVSMLRLDGRPAQAGSLQLVGAFLAVGLLAVALFPLHGNYLMLGVYFPSAFGFLAPALVWFQRPDSRLRIRLRDALPDWRTWRSILSLGLPTFVLQASFIVYGVVVNNLLSAHGGASATYQLSAFAIVNGYVAYMALMLVRALTYALTPIVSYNFGARRRDRLRDLLRVALAWQVAVCAAFTVVIHFAGYPLCLFFAGGDARLAAIAARATRIVLSACALGYMGQLLGAYFGAVQNVRLAVFAGLLRYVVLCVPLMLVLAPAMGVDGVWFAHPVADVACGAVSLALAAWEWRRLAS